MNRRDLLVLKEKIKNDIKCHESVIESYEGIEEFDDIRAGLEEDADLLRLTLECIEYCEANIKKEE